MSPSNPRLISLDVFRGLAIAAMILVNTPGSWAHVYPPLLHAEWHGFTPTDLIFPAFLLIAGVALAFALGKYLHPKPGQPQRSPYGRLVRRCLLLFGLGLFLNALGLVLKTWPAVDWASLRWLGVLQRISLAYLGATLLVLNCPRRWLRSIIAGILLVYWALLMWVPVPDFPLGDLSPEGNVAGYIDRLLLGASHLYTPHFDPEGFLSTLPAIATVLLGYVTGDWLRSQPRQSQTSMTLILWGLSGVIVGGLWGLLLPINKQLWTSSYVLYSAGWSLLVLALCFELIEVRRIRRWGFPWRVMGMNAIFVFVASGVIIRLLYNTQVGRGEDAPSTYAWLYETLFVPWAGNLNGSLAFAITNVFIWLGVVYAMYRWRWFIKL
ncbi:MAG: heparan-alpha-glucosaminide N-acetyltransferase domain-containing protein [Cyanobacteria bacterium P01_G01_bin.54]